MTAAAFLTLVIVPLFVTATEAASSPVMVPFITRFFTSPLLPIKVNKGFSTPDMVWLLPSKE